MGKVCKLFDGVAAQDTGCEKLQEKKKERLGKICEICLTGLMGADDGFW
jgi:hypothetical protein